MALYLGRNRVCPVIGGSGAKCLKGTVVSDDNGIVTFPELTFTPNVITVWNITEVDNEGGSVDYLYEGVMLMAVRYDGDYWISQGLHDNSGSVYISNATADFGSCIYEDGNVYSFRLSRAGSPDQHEDTSYDLTNTVFNYAIYE